MAIVSASIPEGAPGVIGRALAPLIHAGAEPGGLASHDDEDGPLSLELAAPHALYRARLSDVARGRLLDAVRPGGWRFLVIREGKAEATATVEKDDSGALVFSHVSRGPYVAATVEGIERAEALPDVSSANFELRFLDVLPLRLRALWLHGGEGNLLVPLAPAPRPLVPYRPYSEHELVAAVRDGAVSLLAQLDGPDA